MKGYRKLPFTDAQAVGAVSNGAFSGVDLGETVNEEMYVSSLRGTFGCRDYTVGEGPVTLWVAHSDYSNTEVEEAIEATNGWDQGDLIARERARRKVRLIGQLPLDDQQEEVLNDGKPIRVRLGWLLEEGDTLQFGVHARGGALTSGLIIDSAGHVNAWRK